jgi:sugar phosphate isomerase/epimerase
MSEVRSPVITYCSNIHPGESWDEIFRNLQTHFPVVKKAISPDESFPIGLRLSHRAAMEIDEKVSARLLEWCRQEDCYIATLNGFPYGVFHNDPVKESAYLPDWRHEERLDYTRRLSDLLGSWLPEDVTGSISTVPVGFRKFVGRDDDGAIKNHLLRALEHLDRLAQNTGKEIILSLEPEPGCLLETTEDLIAFMEQVRLPDHLRHYLGVCFDCCHQAVEFEEATKSLAMIAAAGIRIGKVQASSALSFKAFDQEILERFVEPCYLHQVVIKHRGGHLTRYNDLPDALLAHHSAGEEEWRIHFHVPVFISQTAKYGTTQDFLAEVLRIVDDNILIEVETYTWDVLPRELQTDTVTESIIRELQWVKAKRDEANRRP